MESQDWVIRPKALASRDDGANDPRVAALTEFFASPDKTHSWAQWQRMLLEDRFVTDAAALYKRRDRKGNLYALEVVDGATLKPILDGNGRTPLPPDPAYQQILHGVVAADYTSDELMYLMRNPRSWKAYGYSEVEQVVVTVNVAIRRTLFSLEYYREGSQPDAFLGLPKEWTPDQIMGFQKGFDGMMAGNLAARRRLKMIPGDAKYQETKQPPLKDMYDEWLARVICFAFSISPEPFVQHTNKGTAETAHDRAIQEGLAPLTALGQGVLRPGHRHRVPRPRPGVRLAGRPRAGPVGRRHDPRQRREGRDHFRGRGPRVDGPGPARRGLRRTHAGHRHRVRGTRRRRRARAEPPGRARNGTDRRREPEPAGRGERRPRPRPGRRRRRPETRRPEIGLRAAGQAGRQARPVPPPGDDEGPQGARRRAQARPEESRSASRRPGPRRTDQAGQGRRLRPRQAGPHRRRPRPHGARPHW